MSSDVFFAAMMPAIRATSERVPLVESPLEDQLGSARTHQHRARGDRLAVGYVLGGDVDHSRLRLGVPVAHGSRQISTVTRCPSVSFGFLSPESGHPVAIDQARLNVAALGAGRCREPLAVTTSRAEPERSGAGRVAW